MAKKIRMILTQMIEYEPNPKDYCNVNSLEDMANIDAHTDKICSLFDTKDAKLNITWEILSETEDGKGCANTKEHWERTGKTTPIE